MHTFKECQVKVNGIKTIVDQIKRISNDPTTVALCESASEMCTQVIREKDVYQSEMFLREEKS